MPLTLLDYGRPNPFGETVGKPKRLAWPVNVYRVTLPKVSEDHENLNPFERVILKLIDAGGAREAEALAQETCLPADLVQCVLLRLHDNAYVDEHNQIITQRRDQWSEGEKAPKEFVTACLFLELATGRILPNLLFLDAKPLQKREGEERLYRRIHCDETHRKRTPTPRDVIAALRAMRNRAMAFGDEPRLPLVQQITIADDAELYYLDCPIAIQKSDGEFRIADPFGNGCSLVLEGAFDRRLQEDSSLGDWLMTWKQNLSNRGQNNRPLAVQEPYDNDANRARYPNLLSAVRVRRHRQFRSIEQIHAALEWAIFYSCVQLLYTSAVQRLKLTDQSDHPDLLRGSAEALSLILPETGLFPVRDGKLDDFLAGKAEMGTVLSLAILMAAGDPGHPLRRIAASHPDFIGRLFRIKKERDDSSHGAGRLRSQDVELPVDGFMREVVTALLPSITFADSVSSDGMDDAHADSLLDARTGIQCEFGFVLFNRIETNIQDRLIAAERFWISCADGDDALVFACDVYAALQGVFRRSLAGLLPPEVQETEYVSTAQKNAEAHGLGLLPACLLTVKRSAIRETLTGNDQTLQSCVVAFLLVSSGDTLSAIAQAHPSFIADAAHVVDSRGHGNEPLPLPRDDIRTLRKAAYTIIKTLLEV